MKQTLFLCVVTAMLVLGCTKKPETQNCYICASNDSVSSNIPALANAHYYSNIGHTCQLTTAQKDFLVKKNTKTDTLYFKNDTLSIEHWTINCDLDY
jgi:hypothetical protein